MNWAELPYLVLGLYFTRMDLGSEQTRFTQGLCLELSLFAALFLAPGHTNRTGGGALDISSQNTDRGEWT